MFNRSGHLEEGADHYAGDNQFLHDFCRGEVYLFYAYLLYDRTKQIPSFAQKKMPGSLQISLGTAPSTSSTGTSQSNISGAKRKAAPTTVVELRADQAELQLQSRQAEAAIQRDLAIASNQRQEKEFSQINFFEAQKERITLSTTYSEEERRSRLRIIDTRLTELWEKIGSP